LRKIRPPANAGDNQVGGVRTLPLPGNSALAIGPISYLTGATNVLDFFSGSGVYVATIRASRVRSEGCVGRTGICLKRTKEVLTKSKTK